MGSEMCIRDSCWCHSVPSLMCYETISSNSRLRVLLLVVCSFPCSLHGSFPVPTWCTCNVLMGVLVSLGQPASEGGAMRMARHSSQGPTPAALPHGPSSCPLHLVILKHHCLSVHCAQLLQPLENSHLCFGCPVGLSASNGAGG